MTSQQVENTVLLHLQYAAEPTYRDFQAALMPTVDKETVLGVRTPFLRGLAKEYKNTEIGRIFRDQVPLPHRYYEENNLHAFLIEYIDDYDACIAALERFLPHVNNWATCDSMVPKVLIKNPERLREQIELWLDDPHPYTVRFGIGMAMRAFLDECFDEALPCRIASIERKEYYIRMMIAWYFATALAKQYYGILPYLTEKRLSLWVHNKTIQKAIESYRISDTQKAELRCLKRKI